MIYDAKFYWLLVATLLVGILEFLALGGIRLPLLVEIPFLLGIILGIGHQTLWHGLKALLTLNFRSINALMLIAVIGAFYLGQYEEAAVVIVLYTLAEKLEDLGIEKSQSSINILINRMPKTVTLKDSGISISIDHVKIGNVITIKPGEMISLDGRVTAGSSYVDESTITGEPIAKDKSIGDQVYAGTLNKQGYLEVEVLKTVKNTTFAKIKELTFHATQVKAKTQKFIETFSQYYTPIILLLALLIVIIPPLFFSQPFNSWLLRGLTLIVIACPCALVISTPISIYSAIGNASMHGALIKGGRFLEAIGQIKAIAFDKTRTLTYGNPLVTDIIPFGKYTKEELLACVAGAELLSEHPLAQSIVEEARSRNLKFHPVSNYKSVLGKGAQVDCLVCQDRHRCIGKLSFILEEHQVPQHVINVVDQLQNQGKTSILIANHREVEGIIALMDKVRLESKDLIREIREMNIVPIMLTGDQKISAEIVAKQLNIREIRSDLLPEGKAIAIQKLLNQYQSVAMVGDGINDAPALALSSVGITISSLGSDTAIEAASIVILNDRFSMIPFLIRLGKRTIRTIQLNTALAISIKLIFISLALIGISNLALAIFADVGVTLIVVLISLRLLR